MTGAIPRHRSVLSRRVLPAISLLAGVTLLFLAYRMIDLPRALEQLRRIGAFGFFAFLVNVTIIFLGPAIGWHVLLRSEGIPVTLAQTLKSALMGRAWNMLSPFMYFGGEGVRTFHIARATGIPRRRVLATVIAGELQVLSGLTLLMFLASGAVLVTGALPRRWVLMAFLGTGVMAALLVLLFGLFLGKAGPAVRVIDLLVRCRIFPKTLGGLRASALEMESTVREILTRRRGAYAGAFLVGLLSPVCHFAEPLLFYLVLRRTGAPAPLPSVGELAVLFVLSQILFILPVTPGGIGVYEGGIIGIFALLGRPAHDGAAFGLLIRLDDFLYAVIGAFLILHHGTGRLLREAGGSAGDAAAPPTDRGALNDGAPVIKE